MLARRSIAAFGIAVAGITGPVPLPSLPTIPNPLASTPVGPASPVSLPVSAAGVVVHAVTKSGFALAGDPVLIYPRSTTVGTVRPVAVGITDPTGTAAIPLARVNQDTGRPDYVAVLYGTDQSGADVLGIQYFTLAVIPQVSVNLSTVPPPPSGAPCFDTLPGGAIVGDIQDTWEQYDVSQHYDNVHVGDANGAGTTTQADAAGIQSSNDLALGEDFETSRSRTTTSEVGFNFSPTLDPQSWILGGYASFGASGSSTSERTQAQGIEQAGEGAEALVVNATWTVVDAIIHCANGQRIRMVSISPDSWTPGVNGKEYAVDDFMDSYASMEAYNGLSMQTEMYGGVFAKVDTGRGRAYTEDYGLGIVPILGFNYSTTTSYDQTTSVTVYPGKGCGNTTTAHCWYYTVDEPDRQCPDGIQCIGDVYTAVAPKPANVPVPVAPQPCQPVNRYPCE